MTQPRPDLPALDELGSRLRAAATRPPSRRHRTRRFAAVAMAALVAFVATPAIASISGVFDFGRGESLPVPGEPGGPPPVAADVPPERRIDVAATLAGPGGEAELRRRFAPYGIELEVTERPVAPAAVGRVFSLGFPRRARFDTNHRMVLEDGVGGTVQATIGRRARAAEASSTAGLSLEEALPEVAAAIDRDDPDATGRALVRLGYRVRWQQVIDNPDRRPRANLTGTRRVAAPPPGQRILSVLNAKSGFEAIPGSRELTIEIAPAGSKILEGHP